MAIKAQAIVNFILELTPPENNSGMYTEQRWTLHVDGSANVKRGAKLVLKGPNGQQYKHTLRFGLKATNNEAEYKTLLSGLRIALELQVRSIEVFTNS